MKLLLERWNKFLNESKLAVFDFDDTLAVSDSKIILTKASGEIIEMTPAEYNVYTPEKGDSFNYSQFKEIINPRKAGLRRKFDKEDLIRFYSLTTLRKTLMLSEN